MTIGPGADDQNAVKVVAARHRYLVLRHEFDEIVEQIMRIVRTRRGFRVILHAEHRLAAVAEAFQRLVVQIHVRDFDVARVERIRIHREAVIVRGDLDALRQLVDHRMIGAAMPELQLVSFAAQRQPENLVTQADAEDRRLADQSPHIIDLRMRAARDRPARWKETRRPASAPARLRRRSAPEPPSPCSPHAPGGAGCCA